MTPVITSLATPPLAVNAPKPVTDPAPPLLLKVTLRLLSAPEVTVLPAASSMVAVNVSDDPDARLAPPLSTICVAGPKVTVTVRVLDVVDP